ncbi:DUF2062 domain-containing protein [Aliikangiella sp. G2MR2-5]|uniref:DUF2062 domain-containing protein n=1 Tax=Aliikangiella sp. G2MR2-5 TaxID=2788943 RepID=UPI0018AB5713|nr:DUF2062 domain-containing protein [Aliikangiella sp. G2MR2-5]
MPRKLIKRYLPDPDAIKENRFLRVFGKVIHDPQLWHLTRYSVGHAFLVGLFCAFIPVPFQMVLAAGGAIVFRANIAISIALVWVTNPLTMPVIFGFAYLVGLWTLGQDTSNAEFELSWDWLAANDFWAPFLWGCFLCGTICAILGYLGIRLFWRLHILSAWQERVKKREKAKQEANTNSNS